ncbi:MAG TPA: hypothetical protein PLV92_08520, partial [Pirellulaceae bacterium]|nr:hypothetical protein [Pirellulaceae bacterium]
MSDRRRASAVRGFTLLELILALSLTILILGAMALAIRLNLKTLDSRRNTVENTQLVRAVFRAMSDDLRSAVQMEPIDFNGVQAMVSPASALNALT